MSAHADWLMSLGATPDGALSDRDMLDQVLAGLTRGDRPRWMILAAATGWSGALSRHTLRTAGLDPDETALPPTSDRGA